MLLRLSSFIGIVFLIGSLASCKHEKPLWPVNPGPEPGPDTISGYPLAIEQIVVNRCATAGCHNQASYQNAGGLLLDSWENMMKGGNNGSVIVPFSPGNSPLLFFINTHEALGPVAVPTMPLNQSPLTQDEYMMIASWVANGAPNKDGEVAFSSNPATRQKIYMTMQGCDQIAVVDAETRLVMRYIPIGVNPNQIESAHRVNFSPDGKYAYACFSADGTHLQKIDVDRDSVIAEVNIGSGSWNVLVLSEDGNKMIVSDTKNGSLVIVDAVSMTETRRIKDNSIVQPHGIVADSTFSVFFVTSQSGNTIMKIIPHLGQIKKVPLDNNPAHHNVGTLDPHEIMMTPDYSRYFATCESSDDVRVMDVAGDSLLKIIPVGKKPQELAISRTKPYVFVTCMEDVSNVPGHKGSVYAINYNTYQVTRIDGPFYEPHGITVDDKNGTFYVLSRNTMTNGPAPHHTSSCGGRNGYYHVYDLNTFERLPKRYEVTVDPYSADTRFK